MLRWNRSSPDNDVEHFLKEVGWSIPQGLVGSGWGPSSQTYWREESFDWTLEIASLLFPSWVACTITRSDTMRFLSLGVFDRKSVPNPTGHNSGAEATDNRWSEPITTRSGNDQTCCQGHEEALCALHRKEWRSCRGYTSLSCARRKSGISYVIWLMDFQSKCNSNLPQRWFHTHSLSWIMLTHA